MIDEKANVQTYYSFHDCVFYVLSRRGVWDILSCLLGPLVSHPSLYSLVSKYLPNSSCFALQPTWEIADPILSLLGACVVLASTLTVLRDSINILLEGKSKY